MNSVPVRPAVAARIHPLLGTVIGVLLSCLFCASPMISATLINNIRLARFASQLYDYPLPPDTVELTRESRVGLFGNGNHCDYEVISTFASYADESEIREHYADLTYSSANPASSRKGWNRPFHSLDFSCQSGSLDQLCYSVRLSDVGSPPGFDLRCH